MREVVVKPTVYYKTFCIIVENGINNIIKSGNYCKTSINDLYR